VAMEEALARICETYSRKYSRFVLLSTSLGGATPKDGL
jgi:hypothetical protein